MEKNKLLCESKQIIGSDNMIYLLKVSANSKRFGELIERNSYYSEVYSSLDKAVEEGKAWMKERLKFLNLEIENDLSFDENFKNEKLEYSFTVTELDLDYINKFNNLEDEEKDKYIEPTHKIYNYNINGVLLNIELEYRCANGENLRLKYYEPKRKNNQNATNTKEYTFENFIVNDNNSFAYNAALAICENYGDTYNPFFIYGPNGAGKTHLINAIKSKILLNNSKIRITHISSEEFIRQLVISLKKDEKESFRKRFNNIDILIIEDIQFLFGKTRIEEELAFIMKSLCNKKIQIILSCDIEPEKIYFENQDIKNILFSGLFVPINDIM